MNISLKRINNQYLFEGTNKNGHKILLDNTGGENSQGVSPMEAVLMAVAGCSGIDIVAILTKQRQEITHFSAEVEGERFQVAAAKPFKTIKVKFILEGKIDLIKAKKSAELSFEKYCSVSKTLEPTAQVEFEVWVNGEKA